MSRRPGRGSDQFPLRFPDGMRDQIRLAAEKSGRSINAEIIHRLEATLEVDASLPEDSSHVDNRVDRLTASLGPKAPEIKIQIEALPEGDEAVQVSLLQFIKAFSQALRESTEPTKEPAPEKSNKDPGPKLLPPDELDASRDD